MRVEERMVVTLVKIFGLSRNSRRDAGLVRLELVFYFYPRKALFAMFFIPSAFFPQTF